MLILDIRAIGDINLKYLIPETEIQKIENALYIVPTPIGNLKDITLRALEVLSNVNLIAAEDTRKSRILLNHYKIENELISFYSHNEEVRIPQILEKLKNGNSVALVSDAGTPGISDPAYSLIRELIIQNIKIIPLPGATAFVPTLIASGLITRSFVFEGFLTIKKGRKTKLEDLKNEKRTIVFYESPHRIIKTLEDLFENFGDRKIVVAKEITKFFEEFFRGKISEVLNQLKTRTIKGEFVIVVEGLPYKDIDIKD